jgi:hypothetical protein
VGRRRRSIRAVAGESGRTGGGRAAAPAFGGGAREWSGVEWGVGEGDEEGFWIAGAAAVASDNDLFFALLPAYE